MKQILMFLALGFVLFAARAAIISPQLGGRQQSIR
jgi:hypothetical protein